MTLFVEYIQQCGPVLKPEEAGDFRSQLCDCLLGCMNRVRNPLGRIGFFGSCWG
jgi:hypothetical protein